MAQVEMNGSGAAVLEGPPPEKKEKSQPAFVPSAEAIWPKGQKIEVVGGSGEYCSGKTLWGLLIDPGPRTLCYDNEGSAANYEGLGFERVDVAAEILKKFPAGASPLQRFVWWREDMRRRCKPGRYNVVMVDPFSEIEQGLTEYVYENAAEFGCTKNQFDKSGGLFWGAVKDYQKQLLDELRARCKCFYFVMHMRNVFQGNVPTGKREPKGKETLMELASLYLEFDRKPDAKGNVPQEPAARVLKSRLAHTTLIDGRPVVHPILPPRLPVATPEAIRQYILKPANYDKLSAKERVPEEQMSDADKLRLESLIATQKNEAAQAELSRLEMLQRAAAQQAAAKAAVTPPPDQSAEIAAKAPAKAVESAKTARTELCTPEQQAVIRDMLKQAFTSADEARAFIRSRGASVLAEFTHGQAVDVLSEISAIINSKNGVPQSQPPFDSPVTQGQLDTIRQLVVQLGVPHEAQVNICKTRGRESFREFTFAEASELVAKLRAKAEESRGLAKN